MSTITLPEGVQITAEVTPEMAEILTPEALALVAKLHRAFEPRRVELLAKRQERAARLDAGEDPDFLPETKHVRDDPSWKVAPAPADLQDRRVEITGPVDRKMIINALNSGAKVFMADFEDSNTPTWANTIEGQINLRDAVDGTISFASPERQATTRSATTWPTLLVRPRGWHLLEKHVLVDGKPVSAGIFDFALFLFHNAEESARQGHRPVLLPAQAGEPPRGAPLERRLRHGAGRDSACRRAAIRATVLIETILAAFEMDEILYELRDHSAGLNCGRWDYIFSFIKKFRNRPGVRPGRPRAGHHDHALHALATRCSPSRPATAAACTPSAAWRRRSRSRTTRWPTRRPSPRCAPTRSARPATATTAPGSPTRAWCRSPMEAFDAVMPGPNQIDRLREDVEVTRRGSARRSARGPDHRGRPAHSTSASACSTSAPG